MARHRHKNSRVKVYFRYKGRCFRLMEAINFGTKTSPELKIKGLTETYLQTKDDEHRFDGHFHVGQLIRFVDGDHVEFTYHKDWLERGRSAYNKAKKCSTAFIAVGNSIYRMSADGSREKVSNLASTRVKAKCKKFAL